MWYLFLSRWNILCIRKLEARRILYILIRNHKILIVKFLSLNIRHIWIGMTCVDILRAFNLLNGHLLMLRMYLTLAFNSLLIEWVLATILQTWNVVTSILFNRKSPWRFLNHHTTTQLSIMIRIIIFVLTQKSNLLIFFTIQHFTAYLIFLNSTFWWIVFCCRSSVLWFVQCWVIIVISNNVTCQLVQVFMFLSWKILKLAFRKNVDWKIKVKLEK